MSFKEIFFNDTNFKNKERLNLRRFYKMWYNKI